MSRIGKTRRGWSRAVVSLAGLGVLVGCADSATTGPRDEETLRVAGSAELVIQWTGGIDGRNFKLALRGDDPVIVVEECGACPWETGQILAHLSVDEAEQLAGAFFDAGLDEAPYRDFGTCGGCSDQVFLDITYTDASGAFRVTGDGPSLPEAFSVAAEQLLIRAYEGDQPDCPPEDDGDSGESSGLPVEVELRWTGGFSYRDFTIELHGSTGDVTATACVYGCAWAPGQVVGHLDAAGVRRIVDLFVEGGIHDEPQRDFGLCEGCADQLHVEIRYTDPSGTYLVIGDQPVIPDGLEEPAVLILLATEEDTPACPSGA